ncbi:metal-dependent hydrolase [Mycobacterium intermedium]|uniref:Metal-dependent hydrolase n=1 Tax=Mycobacterium intermedium TaxID=28445 RepID=A0A1E3S3S3_MYCIE|nr:metal-dependent hydrolase [Mycobacterium intermedium]MCV6964448.1 metal-dependent hydrolase [Mycobacterium intermedium]ODQ96714.1 metal-dependent hydrolase [Mycobacterium intermedium]OPE45720.1 metal-dependent hydrolase [Mycobacterium intermedium]ORA93164.1 metal-dependent hydrolase [Mycobacterium intermedium]
MTDLQVRRVRFDFSRDDVPFNWQPERPAFGMLCNLISLFAPGFEKFIVDGTREAIPLMRRPEDVEEATAYLRQEAQHSAAHMSHVRALSRRWPGLQDTMQQVIDSFDHLTATKPLAWRLAYPAVVEATFTPYFKVFLDHEDKLFRPGDERVASLFIWHFVEEIEHRSSALLVYNAVHDSYPYRLKTIGGVVKHISEILSIIATGFQEHVPPCDGGQFGRLIPNGLSFNAFRDSLKATRELCSPGQGTYAGVPRREVLEMITGLVRSQSPGHDPKYENLPPFAGRWLKKYDENPKVAARWYTLGANAIH